MKFPTKISPDSLREAIVDVRFASNLPRELFLGVVIDAFDNSYFYANRQPRSFVMADSPVLTPQNELRIEVGTQSFLYNENIIIKFLPGSILFTCTAKYIGWESYFDEIKKALTTISKNGKIKHWNRVGVRYISEYPLQDLRQCTKFNFQFGYPDIKSESVAFKSDFLFKGTKVVLTLSNQTPVLLKKETGEEVIPTSFIDIDVITELNVVGDLRDLFTSIDNTHNVEKELFFLLLKPEFIETLNPVY